MDISHAGTFRRSFFDASGAAWVPSVEPSRSAGPSIHPGLPAASGLRGERKKKEAKSKTRRFDTSRSRGVLGTGYSGVETDPPTPGPAGVCSPKIPRRVRTYVLAASIRTTKRVAGARTHVLKRAGRLDRAVPRSDRGEKGELCGRCVRGRGNDRGVVWNIGDGGGDDVRGRLGVGNWWWWIGWVWCGAVRCGSVEWPGHGLMAREAWLAVAVVVPRSLRCPRRTPEPVGDRWWCGAGAWMVASELRPQRFGSRGPALSDSRCGAGADVAAEVYPACVSSADTATPRRFTFFLFDPKPSGVGKWQFTNYRIGGHIVAVEYVKQTADSKHGDEGWAGAGPVHGIKHTDGPGSVPSPHHFASSQSIASARRHQRQAQRESAESFVPPASSRRPTSRLARVPVTTPRFRLAPDSPSLALAIRRAFPQLQMYSDLS
nr:unnamed protein product [Digitaria exilis]